MDINYSQKIRNAARETPFLRNVHEVTMGETQPTVFVIDILALLSSHAYSTSSGELTPARNNICKRILVTKVLPHQQPKRF